MLFRSLNRISPSQIRVESDELTYNMHVILRFEIENALLNRKLKVCRIPEIWNEKMKEYLGIYPVDDSKGCLQDIHWSLGSFGYFPTYTLGKLYSAMIWKELCKEMPETSENIKFGNLLPIRKWLKEKIHKFGRTKKPAELLKEITGESLNANPFFEYIVQKIETIY